MRPGRGVERGGLSIVPFGLRGSRQEDISGLWVHFRTDSRNSFRIATLSANFLNSALVDPQQPAVRIDLQGGGQDQAE